MDNVQGWPWLPQLCPPDMYFIDWVRERNFEPKMILHVGTGLHHKVGIECCAMGHKVIGVTVSREEVVSRVFRVEDIKYQVFYDNINTMDLDLLPKLDIVTMFHFGEMESDFGGADPAVLADILAQMNSPAYMVFYNHSAAWDRASKAVEEFVTRDWLKHIQTYEQLEIYRADV